MARPSDLIPNRYEVVKLITGAEICGMTRDMDDGIEILLPMTCNLQPLTKIETLATFIPYAPLSAEQSIWIPHDCIMHRNNMNPQFIDFYDSASTKWSDMVESGNIPIVDKANTKEVVRQTIDDLIKKHTEEYMEDLQEDDFFDDLEDPNKIIH